MPLQAATFTREPFHRFSVSHAKTEICAGIADCCVNFALTLPLHMRGTSGKL